MRRWNAGRSRLPELDVMCAGCCCLSLVPDLSCKTGKVHAEIHFGEPPEAATIAGRTFSAPQPFSPAPDAALNSITAQPRLSMKPMSTTTVRGRGMHCARVRTNSAAPLASNVPLLGAASSTTLSSTNVRTSVLKATGSETKTAVSDGRPRHSAATASLDS
jgi:hypothetical protein